ncbi:MAG: xanthine dehydrogenase family protein subunit M [Myxococcota bacterium]
MKPAPFEYAAPSSLDEAISLLQQHGDEDVKLLAGGQSLVPLLSMRMARPELLIDLNPIDELQYIREENGGLAIGAMTRKRAVEESELVRRLQPVLLAATQLVAHPQIRNRGTVGGSMAHADPAAEYPALAIVLGVELRTAGPDGERRIAAEDFFQSYLTTALEPVEVLIEVRVPILAPGTGWSFLEVARRHGDFAMTGAAVTLRLDGRGSISEARIVLFGVGPTAVRIREVEQLVMGEQPSDRLFQEAGRAAGEGLEDPLSDVHASAEFRRQLARVLTARALGEAVERAATPS